MRESLSSHELARQLLALPDMPVATCAMGYSYFSGWAAGSHGSFKIESAQLGLSTGNIGYLMLGNGMRHQPPNFCLVEKLWEHK